MHRVLRIAAMLFAVCGLALLLLETGGIPESQVMGPQADLRSLTLTLTRFASQNGRPPTEMEGLAVLVSAGHLDRIPNDSWHHDYVYVTTAESPGFKVYSRGANGVDEHGEGDDIVSWYKTYSCASYREYCFSTKFKDLFRLAVLFIAAVSLVALLVTALCIAWRKLWGGASAA